MKSPKISSTSMILYILFENQEGELCLKNSRVQVEVCPPHYQFFEIAFVSFCVEEFGEWA